ncbi:unnamed protein product [Mesocestoides corti]|uniref:Uncharacterized protein n=1 Tax=Mesocestoides corti TaxID=53468 RepID=A0A3P6I777_MESCO|nr:unnamed protein product [Mesocestoides corti]
MRLFALSMCVASCAQVHLVVVLGSCPSPLLIFLLLPIVYAPKRLLNFPSVSFSLSWSVVSTRMDRHSYPNYLPIIAISVVSFLFIFQTPKAFLRKYMLSQG